MSSYFLSNPPLLCCFGLLFSLFAFLSLPSLLSVAVQLFCTLFLIRPQGYPLLTDNQANITLRCSQLPMPNAMHPFPLIHPKQTIHYYLEDQQEFRVGCTAFFSCSFLFFFFFFTRTHTISLSHPQCPTPTGRSSFLFFF
ncbi:hypothetical protein BKA57DRAFT_99329 [Linnemannia elongata]|nr:hypothetical protein BKA57DRAFT_99329 [Linnemannia elongata]